MDKIRRANMATKIQKELDAKGEAKEVDPSTIDWLYGTYKTKDEVEREKQEAVNKQEQGGDAGLEVLVWLTCQNLSIL